MIYLFAVLFVFGLIAAARYTGVKWSHLIWAGLAIGAVAFFEHVEWGAYVGLGIIIVPMLIVLALGAVSWLKNLWRT